MDPSNGDSLFNFCNYFNTIQLDKDTTANKAKNNVTFSTAANLLTTKNVDNKKDFKSLLNEERNNDMGSTGASDKSASSIGSESNDSSTCEPSNSDTLLLNVSGLMNSAKNVTNVAAPLNNINNNMGDQQINNQSFRDSLMQGFYTFPSSNCSSPPLSQTSASSISEAVSTNVAFKHNNATILSNFCNKQPVIIPTNNFNSQTSLLQSTKSPFNSIKNENLFPLNSLDTALNSLLSSNKNELTANEPSSLNEISCLLNTNLMSTPPDIALGSEMNRQPAANQAISHLFSNNADCINGIHSKSLSLTGDDNPFNITNHSRKVTSTPFNNNKTLSSNPAISNTSLTFSSNLALFNDLSDQRQSNNTNTAHYCSPLSIASNAQLQARFDYQIRLIANEINSTVQLYLNSIQMRKEQLLKQLDHVRSAYCMLLNQNTNKSKVQLAQLPKITFTRPDQNLFKSITSFGFINTPAFAPCCQVTGEGLSMAIEGEPTCFAITSLNCFNEEILNGGENIDVEIQANEASNQHNSFITNNLHIQKNILDNNNGKYNVTYMVPRGSGLRSINIFVSVNGLLTSNSPFVATVKTERLRENWKLVALYGEEGSEPGKFCRPWGIAITRLPLQKDSNHQLIGDSNPSNIAHNSKSFYNWTCCNFKKDYLLAIADRSNNRIQLLRLTVPENTNTNTTNNAGSVGQFMMNNNNKIEISVLRVFGTGPGNRPGSFDRPAGIAINNNLGQLIVADKDNHRVQVFDLTGNFLFKFGEKGSRAGQFCYPWDVAICSQTSMILVSDTRNRRIQLFNHYGQHLWHCGHPLDSPRGVSFLTPDRYIISDFNKHRLLIIDKNDMHSQVVVNHRDDLITSKYIGFGEGSAWGEFLRPQGLVAIVKKNTGQVKHVQILCADSRNNRIAVYNSLNQNFDYINEDVSKVEFLANCNTKLDRPSGIAIADNILAVIDFGNNRLQIFQNTLA